MASLVKKIDQRIDAAAGKAPRTLGAYAMWVNNADGLDKQLRRMANKESLKRVCLGIGAPPQEYGVVNEADVTVVIYNPGRRGETVTANFALRKGELTESKADAILKALSAVLAK